MDGPLPPWTAFPPVEVASGDDPTAIQKAVVQDERRWRADIKVAAFPTQVPANRAEWKRDVVGKALGKSGKQDASKSDFFLKMLGN